MPKSVIAGIFCIVLTNACSNSDKSAGSSNNGEILELRVEEVSATRAVVRFITSEPTTCEAEYGKSRDGLTLSASDPTMGDDPITLQH